MTAWRTATTLAGHIASSWQGGPGGAFLLFDTDRVQATVYGGLASLEHGQSFTPDTPSRYASISKQMLATCLLLEGIELEVPLGTLLPGLPDAFAAVPLGRALDMTGGLPDMMELQWQLGVPFTATLTAEEVGATLHRLRAACTPPGVEMAYSNTGWRLGQAVLERQAGVPYAELLKRRLFGPLDLAMAFPYDEAEPDEDPLLPALRVMAALLGEPPPEPAPDLPAGLYAAADGPAWAEVHPGAIEFMGARETLLASGGRVRSIPSTLEMDLSVAAGAIEGTIGGVARRLRRVPDGLALDPALAGAWREEVFGAELTISGDGAARWPWMGSLGREVALTPLPGGRALADLQHLMWRHRPCIWLDADGSLRVASHRARVLRFQRV